MSEIPRVNKSTKKPITFGRLAWIAWALCVVSHPYVWGDSPQPLHLLEVSSIGFPTAEKPRDAWKINELKIFNDRLYLGHGDAVVNTGPTDVIYYDLKTKEFVTEFTVDDEAIYKYQVIDGRLVIPGVDATEDWKLGNVYILNDSGWVKHRTVTHGLHVNELASFDGKWYACTGTYFEFGKDELYAFGGVLSSEDEGKSWKLVYATPTDEESVYRVGSLISYKGNLYAFTYAYSGMKEEEVPENYRASLGEPYEDEYLIFTPDVFGTQDVLMFDGNRWRSEDLIPEDRVCRISPFLFKDRLVMSVISGEYIDYIKLKEGPPEQARTLLYTFDGQWTEELSLAFDLVKDVVIKGDKLFLLILKKGQHYIAETSDLKVWKNYVLPGSLKNPKSIESDGQSFYIGMEDGNIFKSTKIQKVDDVSQIEGREPRKILGGATLPRDGLSYWTAITGWMKWGEIAKLSCEVEDKSTITATTGNVSAFTIFVPTHELDASQPIALKINDHEAFRGTIDGHTALVCESANGRTWKVKIDDGTALTFEYTKKIIGKTEIDLTRKGDDPTLGRWKTDVLRWSAASDIALITTGGVRRDLDKGDIALEDLFELNYPNTICTFRVKGEQLRRIMEHNIKQSGDRRCQISGFNIAYEVREDREKNTVHEASIDPGKDYLVATSNYVAERAESFFGEEIKYEDTGVDVTDAMIRWFEQHRTVKAVPPRITIIKEE